MDIKLAEQMLAACLKDEYDFYNKHIDPLVKEAQKENKEAVIPQNIQEEFEQLKDDTSLCEDELASYPEIFDAMQCWVIEISGEGIRESLPDLSKIDVDDFIDQYGNLAHEVLRTIREEGFKVSDMAGMQDGWNIGIPCSESEAKRLCTFLHEKFKTAIELDLMIIYKRFWSHRFPNLYNWETLQEWLQTNTLD